MEKRLEPARSIIAKLGGEARVSELTDTAFTAPYRWQYPKSKGGSGGRIPQKHIPTLLAHARDNGIDLRADEFHADPIPQTEGAAA
jgi:hypothetical protein